MLNNSFATFITNGLNKLSEIPGTVFTLNLIAIANLYSTILYHNNLYYILHQKWLPSTSTNYILGFLISYSIYTSFFWPGLFGITEFISQKISNYFSPENQSKTYEEWKKYSKEPNIISAPKLKYLAITNNNTAALQYYNEWKESEKTYHNFKNNLLSFIFLIPVNMITNYKSFKTLTGIINSTHTTYTAVALIFIFITILFVIKFLDDFARYNKPSPNEFIYLPKEAQDSLKS